jgi:hypothetical protein
MTYAMKLAAPLFLATLTTAQVAQAGSATGTMNVSGNVQGSCTVSAVALNFGAITPGSATAHLPPLDITPVAVCWAARMEHFSQRQNWDNNMRW